MTDINKLIEEEAERQLSTINVGYWHSGESYTAYERGYEEGFITGASFILHQNRWRKVEEEMPEVRNKPYFINIKGKDKDNYIDTIKIEDGTNCIDILCRYATEWKPIE